MKGFSQISKAEFYLRGGFSNPKLIRKAQGKHWVYYSRT